MNRMFKIALTAVMGAALVAPAAAQSDLKDDHWATQSVQELYKIGVLLGYPPSGDFKGARPMTRFEFAVAIYRMYQFVIGEFGKRDAAISALDARVAKLEGGSAGGGATKEDVEALRREIAGLRSTVEGMKGWEGAINELRQLVNKHSSDISQLQVNVREMDEKLGGIMERLTALEAKKDAIKIGGDINLLVLAGNSQDNFFGIEPGGYISGVGRGRYAGAPVGMTRDLTVLHEANLKLSSKINDNVSWKAGLTIGNLFSSLNTGAGIRSKVGAGSTGFAEGTSDVYFNEFAVSFNAALAGQGLSATVGRFGVKMGKYLFERPAFNQYYYTEDIRNNGMYYVDGAMASFKFGKGSVNVMGGRNSDRLTTNGADLNTIGFPGGSVDQSLGIQVMFPIGEMGGINLGYLWHDSNGNAFSGPNDPNRLETYGGELNLKFGKIDVFGAYSKSVVKLNNTTVLDTDNAAWEAGAKFKADKFHIGAGYRRIEANFAAAGNWERIGTVWNPQNVQGFNVSAGFTASDALTIKAKGEFMKPVENGGNAAFNDTDDKINSLMVGLDYKLNNMFNFMFSYENVDFKYDTGTQPFQRWYTIGLGYNMGNNSSLSFKYILSDVDNKGRGVLGADPNGGTRFKGGLLATQLNVRF